MEKMLSLDLVSNHSVARLIYAKIFKENYMPKYNQLEKDSYSIRLTNVTTIHICGKVNT